MAFITFAEVRITEIAIVTGSMRIVYRFIWRVQRKLTYYLPSRDLASPAALA